LLHSTPTRVGRPLKKDLDLKSHDTGCDRESFAVDCYPKYDSRDIAAPLR
jgi:hypothetical protein